MTSVPEVIGRNVRQLREERGWSQKELADLLTQMGGEWTRVAVTALETFGKRSRDFRDVAALCWVFGVSQERLLAGEDDIDLANGDTIPLARLRNALAGEVRDDVRLASARTGSDDPEELARIGAKIGLSASELRYASYAVFGSKRFLQVRDEHAGLTADTPRRSVQAKRGRATRVLMAQLQEAFDAEGRDVVLKRGAVDSQRETDEVMRRLGHTSLSRR